MRWSFLTLLAAACASPAPPVQLASPPRAIAPPDVRRPPAAVRVAVEVDDPITRGELPWWHTLQDGIYRSGADIVVLGVGHSANHHHIAEGFLASKVNARLAVRKAAERIRFSGTVPEPAMQDLFITRERKFLALYVIHVPRDAGLPAAIAGVAPPEMLRMNGRRRVGRHVYEGDRHLYLECDVEGPIANPDWGRTRASARH